MKRFAKRQLREALAYAMTGGQSLHVHNVIANMNRAPLCFRTAVRRGEMIAHLFDQDRERLITTVREFGVIKVYVERKGKPGQHVDLCGLPLTKAEFYCEDPVTYHTMFD